MKNLPTFKQLQYFIALAERRSFSQAAESCYVTQSTLSAGISSLENILGQTVVDRSHRKVIFTPFGESLIPRAYQLIDDATAIVQEAKKQAPPLTGSLRLGIIPTIAPYLLPQILPHFKANYPDLSLELYEDLSDRLVSRLNEGKIEAILLAFPFDLPGLEQHLLFEENFFLAAPKTMKSLPTPMHPEDLQDMNLLLLEDGHCLRDHALEACNITNAQNKKTFSTTSLATLIEMVKHGYGVTLLPHMVVKWSSLGKEINTIPMNTKSYRRGIGLAWRKNNIRADEFNLLGKEILTAVKGLDDHALVYHKVP
jgi:LysR family hydrogen peroxide-inducible transcriptional activator